MKMMIIILMIFISSICFAEVYKWIDDKGGVHFTEDPSNIPEKYKEGVKKRTMEESPPSPPRPRPQVDRPQRQFNRPEPPPQKTKEEPTSSSPGHIPFDRFKYLQEGMTEAEVLSRFGPPTKEEQGEEETKGYIGRRGSVDLKSTVIKRYYYIGDRSKGEKTTIIHIKNGRVFKYERI